MKILNEDLLNQPTGLIVHGVNCQGVMGKGIALSIKKKYPQVFTDYKQYYNNNTNLLGNVIYTKINEELIICSMFIQEFYGNDKRQYVNYNALELGFLTIEYDLEESNKSDWVVKIPKIGCGLAGGDWNIVSKILEKTNLNIEVYQKL